MGTSDDGTPPTADAAPPPSPPVDLELPTEDDLLAARRADRPALAKLLRSIERARARGRPHDRNLARLHRDLERSRLAKSKRAAALPTPTYPPELPVSTQREELLAVLRAHQVVVVCGETGSGKSTQLPKMLLELGLGADGAVGHTQPRRVAARTLAHRIAHELGTTVGGAVGFKVRFTRATSAETCLELMTDGVLLAETRRDPLLLAYDAIIVDEAHERSLNIDFLLGYLLRLLPKRPDLKVVVTSATLDAQRFAEWLGQGGKPAPVVEVSGRLHPVEVRWAPPAPDEDAGEPDVPKAVADAVAELQREAAGDVLVFLPTERDIAECTKVLRGRRLPRGETQVLPLYARLPLAEQRKVFEPEGGAPRVVLATNVAESSVTVPGIRAVVDTGTARTSRYSPRARVQRLPIEEISRAAARQRAGRCGRLGPGTCIRLYDEDAFEKRAEYTTPEIQRSNLAAVMLQMADLGLGRVEDFPFLDPPRRTHVADGRRTLHEIGALDDDEKLTERGRELARLPVDPRLGRILLEAREQGCLPAMLVVVAALETGDPRQRPPGREEAADRAHAAWSDGESDLMTLLAMWDAVQALRAEHGRNKKFARAASKVFLSPARCREWTDVHAQLVDLARERGWLPKRGDARRPPRDAGATPPAGRARPPRDAPTAVDWRDRRESIHRSLLAGFPLRVAERTSKHSYTASDGGELWLWPGSDAFDRKPRWIVAAEVVETDRRWARTVARIDPKDVEEYAPGLVKRTHQEPRWDRASGRAIALERVALGELTVVPRRRVFYDRIDPVVAREIFLRALAEGDVNTGAPFLRHNVDLVNRVAALEARTRTRGLLADLDVRYDFYDRLLPEDVTSTSALQRWRRRAEKHDPGVLFMSLTDLLRGEVGEGVETAYPRHLDLGGTSLELHYALSPGEPDDGVTLRVPLAMLEQVPEERLEWLVPGWLREKAIALVRTLPKDDRRHLVPIPTSVDAALAEVTFGEGPLRPALAHALTRVGGLPVPADAFRPDDVHESLRMRVEVVDEDGEVLDADRDLAALRARLGAKAVAAVEQLADPRWHRDGLLRWDFGALPAVVSLPEGVEAHPALVDAGDSVSLRLLPRADEAAAATRAGLRRLVTLAVGGRVARRLRRERDWSDLLLRAATLEDGVPLEEQLVRRIVDRAWLAAPDAGAPPDVRDESAFLALLREGETRWMPCLDETVAVTRRVLDAWHALRVRLEATPRARDLDAVQDVRRTTRALMARRPLATAPPGWLEQVPRHLAAAERRLERLDTRGALKDAELTRRIRPFEEVLAALEEQAGDRDDVDELDAFRWALEEYRVSVHAQELGTAVKVSPPRLDALAAAARERLERDAAG